MIKKVAIIGPECTGKSDLSAFLADYYNTVWVPEYARTFIDQLERPYVYEDLLTIATGQLELEERMTTEANQLVICDTNLYVIKVWSEFKFDKVEKEIIDRIAQRRYDLYLLTYVDIPWEADPQREHPDRRAELYMRYKQEMQRQATPFVEVKGARHQRQEVAVKAINKILTATKG